MDQIKDGSGNGYLAAVTEEKRLQVEAVTYSAESHANQEHSDAYNMVFDVTPTGAGDCFLYIKNADTKNLIIEGIWIRVASAEQVIMKLNDVGTPVGGTDIVPANLNSGANTSALGTFQAAVDITGLSGGTIINKGWVANTATQYFNFEQDLVLQQNGVYTLYAVTGAVNIAGTIVFHYHT